MVGSLGASGQSFKGPTVEQHSSGIQSGTRSPKRWQGPDVGNCGIQTTEKRQLGAFRQPLALDKMRIRPTMTAQIVAVSELAVLMLRLSLAARRQRQSLGVN